MDSEASSVVSFAEDIALDDNLNDSYGVKHSSTQQHLQVSMADGIAGTATDGLVFPRSAGTSQRGNQDQKVSAVTDDEIQFQAPILAAASNLKARETAELVSRAANQLDNLEGLAQRKPLSMPQECPAGASVSNLPGFHEIAQAAVPKTTSKHGSLWIQSGDSSDFDGYLVASAVHAVSQLMPAMRLAVVVPERRACADRAETDVNRHDPGFSKQVMAAAGMLLQHLCGDAMLVKGPLNQRNIIPLKFACHEPEKYKPAVDLAVTQGAGRDVRWHSVAQLAERVRSENVQSIVLDVVGACGFLEELRRVCGRELGAKIRASGMPVGVMAGILAEEEPKTMAMPGRDPRATMNALYHQNGVRALLELAKEHELQLLFITNNTCNELLRYDDDMELVRQLCLHSLLRCIAECWYGPHLKGKYVPFDWVAVMAMLLRQRWPNHVKTEKRKLWVDPLDSSVLVLQDARMPEDEVVKKNLQGCQVWGEVEVLSHIDRALLEHLAAQLSELLQPHAPDALGADSASEAAEHDVPYAADSLGESEVMKKTGIEAGAKLPSPHPCAAAPADADALPLVMREMATCAVAPERINDQLHVPATAGAGAAPGEEPEVLPTALGTSNDWVHDPARGLEHRYVREGFDSYSAASLPSSFPPAASPPHSPGLSTQATPTPQEGEAPSVVRRRILRQQAARQLLAGSGTDAVAYGSHAPAAVRQMLPGGGSASAGSSRLPLAASPSRLRAGIPSHWTMRENISASLGLPAAAAGTGPSGLGGAARRRQDTANGTLLHKTRFVGPLHSRQAFLDQVMHAGTAPLQVPGFSCSLRPIANALDDDGKLPPSPGLPPMAGAARASAVARAVAAVPSPPPPQQPLVRGEQQSIREGASSPRQRGRSRSRNGSQQKPSRSPTRSPSGCRTTLCGSSHAELRCGQQLGAYFADCSPQHAHAAATTPGGSAAAATDGSGSGTGETAAQPQAQQPHSRRQAAGGHKEPDRSDIWAAHERARTPAMGPSRSYPASAVEYWEPHYRTSRFWDHPGQDAREAVTAPKPIQQHAHPSLPPSTDHGHTAANLVEVQQPSPPYSGLPPTRSSPTTMVVPNNPSRAQQDEGAPHARPDQIQSPSLTEPGTVLASDQARRQTAVGDADVAVAHHHTTSSPAERECGSAGDKLKYSSQILVESFASAPSTADAAEGPAGRYANAAAYSGTASGLRMAQFSVQGSLVPQNPNQGRRKQLPPTPSEVQGTTTVSGLSHGNIHEGGYNRSRRLA